MSFQTHFSMLRFLLAILVVMLTFGSHLTIAQEPEEAIRDVKGESPGYYFIPANEVTQDSQSAAISLDTPIRGGLRNYVPGIQVVFETKFVNGNNANITLQIDSLAAKKLLSRDGDEFGIGSLDAGITLTATYNGTDFRADFNPRPHFRYIEPDVLMLTGNAYSIADTSIPPVATVPILIGIKAEATNTGNVTLSVNTSTDYPIFLSNGEQIPAGALEEGEFIFCAFTTIGGVGFRAINLRASRSLKGQLLATLDIPSRTYGDGVDSLGLENMGGWAVESGVTALGTDDLDAGAEFRNPDPVDDAFLTLPLDRISDSQLGWLVEFLNGTTVVNTVLINFGDTAFQGAIITTMDSDIEFRMRNFVGGLIQGVTAPSISITSGLQMTIPATDNYSVKVYLTEN